MNKAKAKSGRIDGILVDLGSVFFHTDWQPIVAELQRLSRNKKWKSASWKDVRDTVRDSGLITDWDAGVTDTLTFYKRLCKFLCVNTQRFSYRKFREIWCSGTTPNLPLVFWLYYIKGRLDLPMAIASNLQELHWEIIMRKFSYLILPLFDTFVLSYSIRTRKPHKKFWDECERRLEIPLSRLLLIDDRADNCQSFRARGGVAEQYDISEHKASEERLRKLFGLGKKGTYNDKG